MKEKVMLKFQSTNRRLVDGITEKIRDEAAIQAKRVASGFVNQNIREGKVDTGNHREYHNVSVSTLMNTLRRNNHPLIDLHYYVKDDKFQPKYVVVATFAPGTPVNGAVLEELVKSTWKHCHVFFNPDDTVTVNCLHRIPQWDKQPPVITNLTLPV